ncbi:MAG: Uma2 family endonuclease [Phenylobacterium sp.]|jgi:Uma2 family endonuclease
MNLKLTEQAYLDGEASAQTKHEYIDGVAYAMAGGTEAHNIISGNIFAELRQGLKGSSCKPFIADMMIKASGHFFYPDVMVYCQPDDADTDLIKHAPAIIVEVLSPGTRKTDMTLKKIAYLNVPSLQEYVLVEQDKCEVEVFKRSDNWASTYYVLGDVVTFESIGVSISVEEIYDRIENEDMRLFLAQKKAESTAR